MRWQSCHRKWQHIRTMSLPYLSIHEWAFIGSSRAIEKREHQINQTKTIITYQNTYKHKNHARNSPSILHMPSRSKSLTKHTVCRKHYNAIEHGKYLSIYLSVRNVGPKNREIEAHINRNEYSIVLQSLEKIIATYSNSIFEQYFMFIGLYFYMSLHITEIKQNTRE